MIWGKTEAGRLEMQSRSLVKERARRNLLLLIDGVKSDVMLLDGLAGVSLSDFTALYELGLITPVSEPSSGRSSEDMRNSGSAGRRGAPAARDAPGIAGGNACPSSLV